MMRIRIEQIVLLVCCLVIVSCSKKDTVAPEQVVISKPQSVRAFSGKNRVKLSWQLPSDKTITQSRIWWNGGKDSATIPVPASTLTDSIIIDNLPEGTYIFYMALLNARGNTSDKVSVNVNVYGAEYAATLKNTTAKSVNYDHEKASVVIQWNDALAGATNIEVTYKDSTGASKNLFTPVYLHKTTLEKFDPEKSGMIRYRTLFLPTLNAIDTFYTAWDTLYVKPGKVLWNGDASKGNSVWQTINVEQSGMVSVVHDPEYGDVWKFDKPVGSHRAEAHGVSGFQAKEGDDIYIGWVSKLTMPQDLSTFAVFQWKSYPTNGSLQNHPLMLRTTDGNLRLRDYQEGDIAHDDWSTPLEINSWHKFVIRIKVSRDKNTGFIEFWYDGVKQTFDNGTTRQYCRTLDSDHCDPKWGVYGGDEGDAVNLVGELKIATSYELAAPE